MALSQFFDAESQSPTHINYANGKTLKFRPVRDTRYKFLHQYCELAYKDQYGELTYGEKVPAVAPVIVDLSLQFERCEQVPFDDEFVEQLVSLTQTALRTIVDIETSPNALVAIYCESDLKCDVGRSAVDIRLQFPLCRVACSEQKKRIRQELIKVYTAENLLDTLDKAPINGSVGSILSVTTLDSYVPMYASKTNTGQYAPKYIESFDGDGNRIDLANLLELVPPSKHSARSRFPDNQYEPIYWLPLILSVEYNNTDDSQYFLRPEPEATQPGPDPDFGDSETAVDDVVVLAKKALTLISKTTYTDPECSETIGKALYNVFEGSPQGARLWYDYSRSIGGSIEDLQHYTYLYRGFKNRNPYNHIQLLQFASTDKPEAFKDWYSEHKDTTLLQSVNEATTGSVARAFIAFNWDRHVFVDGVWYIFNGIYLERQPYSDGPGEEVSNFRLQYSQLRARLNAIISQARDDNDDGPPRSVLRTAEAQANTCLRLVKMLDDASSVRKVLQHIRWILARHHKRALLDHNYRLFVASNMVLVSVDEQPMKERRGWIQDYSVLHSSIPYDPDLDWSSPEVEEYELNLRKIFPDDSIRYYVQEKLSLALRSCNHDGKISIFCGSTHSGKTQFKNDVDETFGCDIGTGFTGYSYTFPSTTLTGQRTYQSSATPDMAHTRAKKLVWFEEPEESDNINEGLMRQESGSCIRFSRFLHDNGGNSEATAMVFGVANPYNMPRFSPVPENKVRIVKIPCESRFLPIEGDPQNGITMPDTEEEREAQHIFLADNNNRYGRTRRCRAQLWMLVQIHATLNFSQGIAIPRIIVEATQEYWNTVDTYTLFCSQHVQSTGDNTVELDFENLLIVFKRWLKDNYPTARPPHRGKILTCFRNILGEPTIHTSAGSTPRQVYIGRALRAPIYEEWFTERIRPTRDRTDGLSLVSAYNDYKQWLREVHPTERVAPRNEFQIHVATRIGTVDKQKRYLGWHLNTEMNQ